jgi:hypothetical protein
LKRTTYVIRDGKAVPKHLAAPLTKRGPRSHLPTPGVISDTMPETLHPANGQHYTSKAKFRAESAARGLTEVGNEVFPERQEIPVDGPTVAEDIARAYDQLASE